MKIKYLRYLEVDKDFEKRFKTFFGYSLEKEEIKDIDFDDVDTYYIVFSSFRPYNVTRHFAREISQKEIEDFGRRIIALGQRPLGMRQIYTFWGGVSVCQEISEFDSPNLFIKKPTFTGLKEAFNSKEHEFGDKVYFEKYVSAASTKHDSFFPMLKDYLENYHKILQAKKI